MYLEYSDGKTGSQAFVGSSRCPFGTEMLFHKGFSLVHCPGPSSCGCQMSAGPLQNFEQFENKGGTICLQTIASVPEVEEMQL